MVFTIIRPDGRREKVRHIQYRIVQIGPTEWHAYRKDDGRLLARSYVSASHLSATCDTCTEPA